MLMGSWYCHRNRISFAWNIGDSYTLQNERTKLFLTVHAGFLPVPNAGEIRNDEKDAFDWFVNEIFRLIPQEDVTYVLENRFHYPVYLNEQGEFYSMKPDVEGVRFTVRTVGNGIAEAVELAKRKKIVLLALGCNPVINAKEEVDRTTLDLPPMDDYDIIKGNRTYRYFEGEPLYPFGYGLTYTSFEYADLHVEYQTDEVLCVSFSVKNTGDTASVEVARL